MAVDQVRVDRLGEDVGRVLLAGPFQKGGVPRADALLHPQLTDCEVPDSPYARAAADSDGRATISADLKGSGETE
eukprot:15437935-Alexandrium_andersonii.AAC.1